MTETEKLLTHATDIASKHFTDPTQETVMGLFNKLWEENELHRWQKEQEEPAGTVH